jgi:hypothetical protein
MVCDQCGHVNDHTSPPTVVVPYRSPGSLELVQRVTTECSHAACFCNLYVPRDLLPSEPAL